jgi:hypothetical protein
LRDADLARRNLRPGEYHEGGTYPRNMRILTKEMPLRHRKLEERSVALHREIVQRIRRNPDLLGRVRERLSRDIRSGRFSISLADAMQEWLDLLDSSSVEQVLELLVDEGENARRLRQSTPFAGILTQEERRRVLEKHESAGV